MRREIEVYNPKREARLEMQLRRRTEELNENLRFQGLLYETIFVLAVLLIASRCLSLHQTDFYRRTHGKVQGNPD